MKSFIFDTGALVQYSASNKEVIAIVKQINQGKAFSFTPELLLAEFFYKICQKEGLEIARIKTTALLHSPTKFLEPIPASEELLFEAGRIKCQYSFISFADSLAVALTMFKNGILVTTDGKLSDIKKLIVKKINY